MLLMCLAAVSHLLSHMKARYLGTNLFSESSTSPGAGRNSNLTLFFIGARQSKFEQAETPPRLSLAILMIKIDHF